LKKSINKITELEEDVFAAKTTAAELMESLKTAEDEHE